MKKIFIAVWKKLTNNDSAKIKKLQQELDILRSIIKDGPGHVCWKDTRSIFLGCNKNFAEIVGLACSEDIVGKTDYDLPWGKDESDLCCATDQEVIQTGLPRFNIEEVVTVAAKKNVTILNNKAPLKDNNGQTLGVICTFVDITENKKIESQLREAKEKVEVMNAMVLQASHDIRSPLMVLKTVLNDFSSLPERQRIDARNAIQRVADIANNLLAQYRQENQPQGNMPAECASEPVAIMLESIVSEKRIQIINSPIEINLQFPENLYDAFISVDVAGFKRVFSNLLNNATEAFKGTTGIITIQLSRNDGCVVITLKDNGCGISEDKLKALLTEGGSFGKKDGSGLGLPYAMNKVREWKGEYSFTSKLGEGTQVEMQLPEVGPANWFRERIDLTQNSTIIVLDDDEYIHGIWDKRFSEKFLSEHKLNLLHFSDPNELTLFCQNNDIKKTVFFLDYELGNKPLNGLDVVRKLDIGNRSTLVTSRYEDLDVRINCQALGVKIIPKFFTEHIPVAVCDRVDAVLIDNDPLILSTWKFSAKSHDKKIITFSNFEEASSALQDIDCSIPVYIDSDLGAGIAGEEYAKILYEMGFGNIYLATGYESDSFEAMPWIKAIVGKEPPWSGVNR